MLLEEGEGALCGSGIATDAFASAIALSAAGPVPVKGPDSALAR